jgi:acyl-CoA thioester hydrolase
VLHRDVIHRTTLRVRYADTDQMGIVYNGKYLEYFEVGRTELLRSLGFPYVECEKSGFRLPLVEAHCRYMQPAVYDDLIAIESRVQHFNSPRLRIEYSVTRDADGVLLCTGYTVHAFVNIVTGKPIRPPQHFLSAIDNGL